MKRLIVPAGLVAVLAAVLAVSSATAKPERRAHHGGGGGHHVIRVVERATTDATTDTGATGDSAGDVLTFANELFDKTNTTKVGSDQGYCVRVVVGASYECTWTALLDGGQIVVQGPFYDTADSTLAITGGTGKYKTVRGEMDLHARDDGASYDFTYKLR
jgi:allene oxide cyclase